MIWKFATVVYLLSLTACILGEDISSVHKVLNVTNCGKRLTKTSTDRISGGERARHGKNPWMVAFLKKGDGWSSEEYSFICGGAILNENWIVTAASCFDYPAKYWDYIVLTGLYKLSEQDGPTVKKHTLSKIIVHPNYKDYERYMENIALVKLKTPIDFVASNGYANAICLPENTEEAAGFATTVGWGWTSMSANKNSDALNEVVVPIISSALCPNYGNNICAGGKGKGFCYYDLGSPLYQEDYHRTSTLLGVVSSGFSCDEYEEPGQYTRMSMYLDWIRKVITEN